MKRFYILIIENGLTYPIQDDLNKFFDWVSRKTGISVLPEYITTDLALKHKDFGIKVGDKSYWGLDGIKEQLRETQQISDDYYHCIFFLYNLKNWDPLKGLAAWTYPNPLYGSAFAEVPIMPEWEITDDIYRMMSHEFLHQLHRICWKKGIITKDTMDNYDDENVIESPTGNRERNLAVLRPYLDKITEDPYSRKPKTIVGSVLCLTQQIAQVVTKALDTTPLLDKFCAAIQVYEGWYPGSHSQKTNNPGNLKYVGQTGSTGQDARGFAIFKDYQSGYNALRAQIKYSASGKSRYYKPTMSIIQFFGVYAPQRDNNNPNAYALFVSQKCGIDPQTPISNLL